jgi:hypothetical protein
LRYRFPRSFRDARAGALAPELAEQIRLSLLLGQGFAFSLLNVGGLTGCAAFLIGWEARRRIGRSGGRLAGRGLAWWCITVGGLNAVAGPLSVAHAILRSG